MTTDTAKTYAQILGIVLTVVGILGFIPALTPDGNLLGLFAVNGVHNIVHILSGVIGLIVGFGPNRSAARLYALIFGIVYGLVTIIGFIQGNTVLGIIPINTPDNILHLLITAASLAVYFISGGDASRARNNATAAFNR